MSDISEELRVLFLTGRHKIQKQEAFSPEEARQAAREWAAEEFTTFLGRARTAAENGQDSLVFAYIIRSESFSREKVSAAQKLLHDNDLPFETSISLDNCTLTITVYFHV